MLSPVCKLFFLNDVAHSNCTLVSFLSLIICPEMETGNFGEIIKAFFTLRPSWPMSRSQPCSLWTGRISNPFFVAKEWYLWVGLSESNESGSAISGIGTGSVAGFVLS
ncbi:hypothetical protein GOP47_0026306 [Adiantum capillus-veneris]|nr:hypothetical protein GOP47_0026306 [Adiantum capillus-veneris]